MDHEPPRLKYRGGRLSLALETLERELPSDEQVERLYADLCGNLYLDESDSRVRKKPRASSAGVKAQADFSEGAAYSEDLADRAEPPHSRRCVAPKRPRRSRAVTGGALPSQEALTKKGAVKQGALPQKGAPKKDALKKGASDSVRLRGQPSWRMVAFAAAASALLTLGLSSVSRTIAPPASSHGQSTAEAATDAALITRELVDWVPPRSAPASAAARQAEARRPAKIQTLKLESALGPALPEVWSRSLPPENVLEEEARPPAYRDSDPWWLSPEAAGGGRLKLNSIPISRVSIDGETLGRTPIVDAWVPPGKHTVTFDHPMFGRKRRIVEVAAGGTEVVAVWFGNEPLH